MKRTGKKLQVNRETIHQLTNRSMTAVVGGKVCTALFSTCQTTSMGISCQATECNCMVTIIATCYC